MTFGELYDNTKCKTAVQECKCTLYLGYKLYCFVFGEDTQGKVDGSAGVLPVVQRVSFSTLISKRLVLLGRV